MSVRKYSNSLTVTRTVANGKSAYEIAVENGFEGTEEEWLESLKADERITLVYKYGIATSNTDWNETTIVADIGASVAENWMYGLYIWKQAFLNNLDDGTSTPYSDPVFDVEQQTAYTMALRYTVLPDKTTYSINRRLTRPEDKTVIDLSNVIDIGYRCDGIAFEGGYAVVGNKIEIPMSSAPPSFVISAWGVRDGVRINETRNDITFIGTDETETNIFFGSSVPSNTVLLDGDSYWNASNNVLQMYEGRWKAFSECTLSEDVKMLALSKAQKTAISNMEAGSITKSEYAYFNTIIAQYIYTTNLGVNTIKLDGSDGKIVGGDVEHKDGEYLSNKGIYLDSDGNAKFTSVYINKANIKDADAVDLRISGNSTFAGDLAIMDVNNKALLTTSRNSKPSASITGTKGTTKYWRLGKIYDGAVSNLTENELTTLGNQSSFSATKIGASTATTVSASNVMKVLSSTVFEKPLSGSGTSSFTAPFNIKLKKTSGYVDTADGDVAGGTTISCPTEWDISNVYDSNSYIKANEIIATPTGQSYEGNAISSHARITDTSVKGESDSKPRDINNKTNESTVYTYRYTATRDCDIKIDLMRVTDYTTMQDFDWSTNEWITYQVEDNVGYTVYVDGAYKYPSTGNPYSYAHYTLQTETYSLSIKSGSVVEIRRSTSRIGAPPTGSQVSNLANLSDLPDVWYEKLTVIGRKFSELGFDANGVWVYTSKWTNLGTSGSKSASSRLVLAGFDSNTLCSATCTYTPNYSDGIHLLSGYTSVFSFTSSTNDWYTGTCKLTKSNNSVIVDASNLSSSDYAYKFAGLSNGTANSYTTFSGTPSISWTKVYPASETRTSSEKVLSVAVTNSTTMTVIRQNDWNSKGISTNDLFTAISVSFTPMGEVIGVKTQSILPVSNGYNIGNSSEKERFDNIHANNFHGHLVGTADSATTATKLQTWKSDGTGTYGSSYPFYAKWDSTGKILKMVCDGYTTYADSADVSIHAQSPNLVASIAVLQKEGFLASDYGDRGHQTEEFFKAFVKWGQTHFGGKTIWAIASPNAQGTVIANFYNNGFASNGFPYYCSGSYYGYAGANHTFGCTSGGNWWFYSYLDTRYKAVFN